MIIVIESYKENEDGIFLTVVNFYAVTRIDIFVTDSNNG